MTRGFKTIRNMLAGTVMALVTAGPAVAVTSGNFTYSAVQTGHFTISPLALSPSTHAATFTATYYSIGGQGCFGAGFNLPQGATLGSVTTWYESNASSNPTIRVFRFNLANNTKNTLIEAAISDDTALRKVITQTIPPNLRVINNTFFAYTYQICLTGGSYFMGARINYTYKTAGD